jgi:hypothetical protein
LQTTTTLLGRPLKFVHVNRKDVLSLGFIGGRGMQEIIPIFIAVLANGCAEWMSPPLPGNPFVLVSSSSSSIPVPIKNR